MITVKKYRDLKPEKKTIFVAEIDEDDMSVKATIWTDDDGKFSMAYVGTFQKFEDWQFSTHLHIRERDSVTSSLTHYSNYEPVISVVIE